jgi:hypothetical protein
MQTQPPLFWRKREIKYWLSHHTDNRKVYFQIQNQPYIFLYDTLVNNYPILQPISVNSETLVKSRQLHNVTTQKTATLA